MSDDIYSMFESDGRSDEVTDELAERIYDFMEEYDPYSLADETPVSESEAPAAYWIGKVKSDGLAQNLSGLTAIRDELVAEGSQPYLTAKLDAIISDIEKAMNTTVVEIERADKADKADKGGDLRPYDKDEYAARKKAERDNAYARIEQATERISKDPVAFKDFLDVMARFPRYSVANTLLIFDQRPEATLLADFESWKRRGESVKKGESAIAILEPGDEYTRDDGSIGVSYNVKKVFDERQTSARHLEPRHPETRELLLALIEGSPIAIKTVAVLPEGTGSAFYDHNNNSISVIRGLDGQQLLKALTVEFAHAAIASKDDFYDRRANHETALFAAYVVAGRYGADNSGQMPALTPRTDDGSLSVVREELSRIRDAAKSVSDHMNKTLDKSRSQESAAKLKPATRGDRDAR